MLAFRGGKKLWVRNDKCVDVLKHDSGDGLIKTDEGEAQIVARFVGFSVFASDLTDELLVERERFGAHFF